MLAATSGKAVLHESCGPFLLESLLSEVLLLVTLKPQRHSNVGPERVTVNFWGPAQNISVFNPHPRTPNPKPELCFLRV